MKKIPTVFVRDEATNRKYVRDEVTPGCEWVLAGEGVATRKYDGTCFMFDGEQWWSRREVKPGKTPPPNFIEVEHDETTGKTVGWEPAEQSGFWKIAEEVIEHGRWLPYQLLVTTFELLGPKVNGNSEKVDVHLLVAHGYGAEVEEELLAAVPRDFDGLREWMQQTEWEGIVWHHPDGRMAKLKKRDFPRDTEGKE